MKNLPWRRFPGAAPPCSEHDLYQTRKAQHRRALGLKRTWECKHYLVTTDTETVRTSRWRVTEASSGVGNLGCSHSVSTLADHCASERQQLTRTRAFRNVSLSGDFLLCGEAENGREAIEKAQLLRPNLIVTDLSMPVMNGLEETRALKKLMPAIPVIIFTAHSDPFVEKEVRAAGVSAVVSKSEAVSVLITTARGLLDQIAA